MKPYDCKYSNRGTQPKGMLSLSAKKNFHIKSLKLYNCRHFGKATKPKGKLSTTAKKNWLLQANEKKDRGTNRRRTFGPNRKIPPKLNLEKIGKLIYRNYSSLKYFENDYEIIIHVFSCLKNS